MITQGPCLVKMISCGYRRCSGHSCARVKPRHACIGECMQFSLDFERFGPQLAEMNVKLVEEIIKEKMSNRKERAKWKELHATVLTQHAQVRLLFIPRDRRSHANADSFPLAVCECSRVYLSLWWNVEPSLQSCWLWSLEGADLQPAKQCSSPRTVVFFSPQEKGAVLCEHGTQAAQLETTSYASCCSMELYRGLNHDKEESWKLTFYPRQQSSIPPSDIIMIFRNAYNRDIRTQIVW